MKTYAYIVHRASEAIGLKDFNSESMEADDFRKIFLTLQDVIRSMNSDPNLTFGLTSQKKVVSGDSLVFKPYTEAEQTIIAGGGAIDITDRIVDFRPTVAPVVYINGQRLQMVDVIDIPEYCEKWTCAWNPSWDQDALLFGDKVGDEVTIQARTPIEIPSTPTAYVKVPERYFEYMILSLAVSAGAKLGLIESLTVLKGSLALETQRINKNNTYHRPVFLHCDLDMYS